MWLVNTSYGWNPGDDLIREGVFNLFGLGSQDSKVFVNRGQTRVNGKNEAIWRILRNVESPEHLASQATGIIMAGSPEWFDFFEEFYEAAAKYSVPIYMVGVGMRSVSKRAPALIDSIKHLVKGATVRDSHAAGALKERGISHEWFPDPAFSASYSVPVSKRYGLVANYRSHGGNGTFKDTFDAKWGEVEKKYGKDIDLVTVHEQGEYAKAKKIFSAPVFYSSDYLDYKDIYSSTRLYLGGRIHGATPVLATGGTAHIIYNSPKISVLEKVAPIMDTLSISSYKDAIPDLQEKDPTGALRAMEIKVQQHKDYWASRR
jgi:hypothetical protein